MSHVSCSLDPRNDRPRACEHCESAEATQERLCTRCACELFVGNGELDAAYQIAFLEGLDRTIVDAMVADQRERDLRRESTPSNDTSRFPSDPDLAAKSEDDRGEAIEHMEATAEVPLTDSWRPPSELNGLGLTVGDQDEWKALAAVVWLQARAQSDAPCASEAPTVDRDMATVRPAARCA